MMFEIDPLIQELYELKEEARAREEPFILKCIHHSHPQVKKVNYALSK